MLKDFFTSLSAKGVAILIIIGILVLVATPYALLSGLADAFLESPEEGVVGYFVAVGVGVLMIAIQVCIDCYRDSRRQKKRESPSRARRRTDDDAA